MLNLFGKKERNKTKKIIQSELDLQLVEGVIDLLKKEPENFSAVWFGNSIDTSVKHVKKDVLVMIKTGQIISPVEPTMTIDQKDEIKELLMSIVSRDKKMLVEKFLSDK